MTHLADMSLARLAERIEALEAENVLLKRVVLALSRHALKDAKRVAARVFEDLDTLAELDRTRKDSK